MSEYHSILRFKYIFFPTGGALGGGVAAFTCGNKFQPVSQVIATMSQERRERLASKIKHLMNKIEVADVILFAALVSGDCSIRSKVMGELVDYLRHEMSMALVEWGHCLGLIPKSLLHQIEDCSVALSTRSVFFLTSFPLWLIDFCWALMSGSLFVSKNIFR